MAIGYLGQHTRQGSLTVHLYAVGGCPDGHPALRSRSASGLERYVVPVPEASRRSLVCAAYVLSP
jgi:hypothetical protein